MKWGKMSDRTFAFSAHDHLTGMSGFDDEMTALNCLMIASATLLM